jgi:hypothetical protein
MAKTQGTKPTAPSPRPLSTPERPAQVIPSPSPQVLAATEALVQDAGQVAGLAERRRFGKAFALLDTMQGRLNQVKTSATPQDEAAIRRASEAVEGADRKARAALADVAKPILEEANAAVDRATDRPNTDEDAVIAAYAEVYPVIRWKDRLPDDARLKVEEFMRRCRGELNDDEWAKAHALAQGRAFPGQN